MPCRSRGTWDNHSQGLRCLIVGAFPNIRHDEWCSECQPQAMRGATILAGVALVAALTSCGGVKIASGAVDDAGRAFGNEAVTAIELSSDDVTRLANQAGVEDDVIRDVAPSLDQQSIWRPSVQGATEAYRQIPEDLRSGLVGLACDVLTGQITTDEQLRAEFYSRLGALTWDPDRQLVDEFLSILGEMEAARQSDDPERQAAAVLTCFTFEHAAGVG